MSVELLTDSSTNINIPQGRRSNETRKGKKKNSEVQKSQANKKSNARRTNSCSLSLCFTGRLCALCRGRRHRVARRPRDLRSRGVPRGQFCNTNFGPPIHPKIQVPEAADHPVQRPPAKRSTLQTVETHRIADNTPQHNVICLQAHCLQVTQSPCTRTSQPSKDEV